jgi:hypothetical protein
MKFRKGPNPSRQVVEIRSLAMISRFIYRGRSEAVSEFLMTSLHPRFGRAKRPACASCINRP